MNVKKKKVLLAALLVAMLTVLAAGAASAEGERKQGGRNRGQRTGGWGAHYGKGYGYCGRYAYKMNVSEVPQEIRDKWVEAQKINIDLRAELAKKPEDRDKEKALELYTKRCALMQELGEWHFKQRLDAPLNPKPAPKKQKGQPAE